MAGPVEFHVYGCCKINVFSTNSYLGYSSEAGVHVVVDPKFEPVYTDAMGPQTPEDMQNMGMLATIDFELIKWDQTVLAELQTHAANSAGTVTTCASGSSVSNALGNTPNSDGSTLLIGSLLKQSGWTFPTTLVRGGTGSSTNPGCETNKEGAYTFGTCYVGPDDFNLGTTKTRHKLTFHTLCNASGVLFTIASS